MSAQSSLPETIVSDPTRLRQVLLNLIGNAIKFTHQGTIDIYVDIVQKDEKSLIRFEVKDSGVGICLDNIQDIFKPFVQIKHSRVQTRTGTGLGLTISRQLVEHLGGNITVQSQEGVGSTFQFTIDPGELSEVPHRELSLRINPESLPLQFPKQFQGRILVVDDLRDIRSLIGLYISRCGLQVEYANNGLEAINKITQSYETDNPFDLIFMDIHMPVKDGLTAAKEIRKNGYSCPLVALTAAHMQGDQERYILAGFNTSLSKPIDQSQMIGIIEQFLPAVGAGVKPHTPLLPQNQADLNPSQTHTEKLEVTAGEAKNILIVEDSQDALNAIANLLEILGWQPLTATCGQEALELAEDLKPDYALVDLNLPDFDGYYVSAQLQKLNPDISIYISSGAEVDYSKACNAVQGHLLKPISLAQLDQLFTSKTRH